MVCNYVWHLLFLMVLRCGGEEGRGVKWFTKKKCNDNGATLTSGFVVVFCFLFLLTPSFLFFVFVGGNIAALYYATRSTGSAISFICNYQREGRKRTFFFRGRGRSLINTLK